MFTKEMLTEEICRATPGLKNFAMRLTRNRDAAKDLYQETMVRILETLDGKKDLEVKKFVGWAHTIMRSLFSDNYRQQRTAARATSILNVSEDFQTEQNPADAWLSAKIQGAMSRLSTRRQKVVFLVCAEDMDHTQVAKRLGIEPTLARADSSRGRKALRGYLRNIAA